MALPVKSSLITTIAHVGAHTPKPTFNILNFNTRFLRVKA